MKLSAILICSFRLLCLGTFLRSAYRFAQIHLSGLVLPIGESMQLYLLGLGFDFAIAALAFGLTPLLVRLAVGSKDPGITLALPSPRALFQAGIVAAGFLVMAVYLPAAVTWLHYLAEVGPDAFEWSYYAEHSWYSITQSPLALGVALVFVLRSARLAAFLGRRDQGASVALPD